MKEPCLPPNPDIGNAAPMTWTSFAGWSVQASTSEALLVALDCAAIAYGLKYGA